MVDFRDQGVANIIEAINSAAGYSRQDAKFPYVESKNQSGFPDYKFQLHKINHYAEQYLLGMSLAVYLATKIPDLQSAPPQPTEFVDAFLGVFEEDLMSGSLDDLVTNWEMGNLTVFVEVSRRLNQAIFHRNYFNFDDGIDAMIELENEVTDLLKKRLKRLT